MTAIKIPKREVRVGMRGQAGSVPRREHAGMIPLDATVAERQDTFSELSTDDADALLCSSPGDFSESSRIVLRLADRILWVDPGRPLVLETHVLAVYPDGRAVLGFYEKDRETTWEITLMNNQRLAVPKGTCRMFRVMVILWSD